MEGHGIIGGATDQFPPKCVSGGGNGFLRLDFLMYSLVIWSLFSSISEISCRICLFVSKLGHAKLILIIACATGGQQVSQASVRISIYLCFATLREKVGARSAPNFLR